MKKITRTTLESLLAEIATKTDKAISRENADELGLDRYLHLECRPSAEYPQLPFILSIVFRRGLLYPSRRPKRSMEG